VKEAHCVEMDGFGRSFGAQGDSSVAGGLGILISVVSVGRKTASDYAPAAIAVLPSPKLAQG